MADYRIINKIIVVPIDLYGYKTWSLIEVLVIFGPKRDEVTGGWRYVHTE
jgi:hypothetical protein